jgi:hypothetical protein
MADKKISALTSASTPLAGTEVLPIVQSGSTVKVAVSDLTAGRAVSGLSFTTSSGSVSTTSGVTVTIYGVPNGVNKTYIVSIGLSAAAPTVYSAVSLVSMDNNVLRTTALQTAALASISVSGQNIQAIQNSGGPATMYWTVTCVS